MSSNPLDRAFDRLHATDFEYAAGGLEGLSNHGPMAAESLVSLGRPDRVEPFVEAYLPKLRPLTEEAKEGIARYERVVGAGDLRGVLRASLPALLPGAVAAGAHGWLRTAHAVHALTESDTAIRRRELAFGLAGWEARAVRLPGSPGARPERGLDVVRALARVPLVPEEERLHDALITEQALVVEGRAGFTEAVEAVDLEALPFSEAVSALAAVSARLFLATPAERFVYLHAITATSALRLVSAVLDEDAKRAALGAVFQVVAALHATHADPATASTALRSTFAPDVDLGKLDTSPAAIATGGAESDDEHDVKLAAAVLREHACAPQEELLAAGAVRLSGREGRGEGRGRG